ncbi:MAG: hypothetical protein ACKVY0_24510 [Prosthecobacter sp.]|uniref:hypothetical protein n=1 Tax=Prosthecobacter sp. TaxID=1965333 RepID=UPI00390369DD
MQPDTLARRLGTTTHVSPLLMKARRLGLRVPGDLERLAVQRGCRYYDGAGDSMVVREESHAAVAAVNEATLLSNNELAVALLSMGLPHSQHRLRIGAAMLAAEGNSASKLAQLARHERCETVVRHIALCGRQVEPENAFWTELIRLLPDVALPDVDVLPHLTRFVAMTGFTRRGRETIMQWIRPTRSAAA